MRATLATVLGVLLMVVVANAEAPARLIQGGGGTTLTDSASLASAISDETGTGLACFNDSPVFVDDITVMATGVRITGADGAVTFLGLGNGNDYSVTMDMDNGTSRALLNTTGPGWALQIAGTTEFNFLTSSFDVDGATLILSPDSNTYIQNNVDGTTRFMTAGAEAFKLDADGVETMKLEGANLAAGACTANTVRLDTTGTRELCICNTGGTAYDCWSATTANGPTD
jgi:hypothetical protein